MLTKTKGVYAPEGWTRVRLGDICLIKKGEQLNKLDMENDGKYPALNGGISPSGYTSNWNTEANTTTISEGGNSCGYVNFMTSKFWSGGHCYSILDIAKNVEVKFLYQTLKFNQNNLMKLRVGSGLPNIQKRALQEFQLEIPPLTEQKKITEILTTADEAIQKTNQIITTTEKLKLGLMQQLFNCDTEGKPFTTIVLGKLAKISSGKTPSRSRKDYYIEGNVPWVKSTEVKFNMVTNTSEKITEHALTEAGMKIVPKGAVLVAMYGQGTTRGKSAILGCDATMNQAVASVIPDSNQLLNQYLFYWFVFQYENLRDLGHGGNQKNLNSEILKKLKVPVPSLSEQKRISSILSSVDEKIVVNQQLAKKLIQLKTGLSQSILTGKKRTI